MNVSPRPLILAGFDLKSLKKWNSPDGGGYQFTLTQHGVPVCEVTNEGNGGEVRLEWLCLRWDGSPVSNDSMTLADKAKVAKQAPVSQVAKVALDAIVKATPEVESFGMMLKPDAGWLMEELVNLADLRKVCKKKTAFRKAGDDDSQYFTINAPCDDKVRAYIGKKYPGATILNDEIGA